MRRIVSAFVAAAGLSACELVAGIGDVTLGRDASTNGDGATDGPQVTDALYEADAPPPIPDAGACPGADGGVAMVEIAVVNDGGHYCIDPFEVTRGELNAYLQSPASLPPLTSPAFCTSQVGSRPAQELNPAAFSLPASSLEWCYAYGYCAWRGKHLCGKIGGGESAPRDWQQVNLENQWDYACVNGALGSQYGYGQPYDAGACNAEGDAAAPVGSYPACHGAVAPFTGIFDLSGNVAEMDDMASAHAPNPNLELGAHGGSWGSGAVDSTCGSYFGFGPHVGFDNVGFRCCAEVSP